jgi:predicted deacylase
VKLSNGAKIYTYGRPKLFLMGGVHGEERAPVMALMTIIKDDLKDVWILPCLNIQGHRELNRFCGKKNLNGEFKEDTTVDFMQELMQILKDNVPTTFVDMHEDVESSNDYIWSDFDNDDTKVRNYCKANNLGLFYQPEVDEYYYSTVGTSQSFARKIGVKNCYTTETAQYAPFDERLKANKKFIKLFMGG